MRLRLLQALSWLALALLVSAGLFIPLGLVEIPIKSYAPMLFYFSLVLLLTAFTLSRLGIFFAGLVRDGLGEAPHTPGYISGTVDKFLWPAALLLAAGSFLFTASFVVQTA